MQLAQEAIGVPFSRPLNVTETTYAAEVDTKTGFCSPYLRVKDIVGAALAVGGREMGDTVICPVPTGACITSTTGGTIEGWDMYGQYIRETVAAEGTTTIAFAGVTAYPADAEWANQYGLPYKYSAAASSPNADVTITASDPAEDTRGTFAYAGAFGADDWAIVEVPYIADRTALFGAAYATRYDTAPEDRGDTAIACTATINSSGVIALTIATSGLSPQCGVTVTFPDGRTVRGLAGSVINHTLSPLWMSKYAKVIADDNDALDRLIAVAFDKPQFASVYANVTGSLV